MPYTDGQGLTSDGKAENYDRVLETVIGKPEVFFAARFSAQGKTPISTMSAGEVKTLMASMLGLENMRAPTSTGVATILRGVGNNFPTKAVYAQDAAGTGLTSVFELVSASISGVPVTQ